MPNQTNVDFIARQNWLEPVEKGLQKAVQTVFKAGGETGRKVQDALHGVWLGDPLHAALTDVPLGAWTAAVVMDATESITGNEALAKGADAAVAIGLIGAVGAAVTGLTDWQHVDGAPRRVGLVHGLLNLSSAALFATSFILRKRDSRGTAKALSATGYAVSLLAARLGGELVFRHGIGTNHALSDSGPESFTPVLAEQELQEDKPHRAEVDGISVVLVKSGGRVFALAEKCAHLGGPLSEGTFNNGVIQCPWHGSQFSMADGQIVHGPSVHPQACFDARIRNGQIEIRRHIEAPQKDNERKKDAA